MRTILLLFLSNLFMTTAWYGHLRGAQRGLLATILIAWCIALPEYALQVPANRLGYRDGFSATELKTIQELVGMVLFLGFAWAALGEAPKWNALLGFALMGVGAALVFAPWAR